MKAFSIVALAFCAFLATAADNPPAPDNLQATETVRLLLHPAHAPAPVLKYRFSTQLVDQIPGNAALLYLSASQRMATERKGDANKEFERVDKWLATPPADLPRAEVSAHLDMHASALNQMRLASLRDRCDFDPPFRTEGFRTLLPYLNEARQLTRLVALQARSQVASGDFDGAADSLRQGFVQARHVTAEPFLVQALVAAAITTITADQAREFVQAAGAPNLYWALSELPTPMIDVRAGMRFEHAGIYFSVPGLKEARDGKLAPEQWHAMLESLMTMQAEIDPNTAPPGAKAAPKLAVTFAVTRDLAAARKWAAERRKIAPAVVEQMAGAQVVGMYYVDQYEEHMQAIEAAMSLPFPQGYPALKRADAGLQRAAGTGVGRTPMAAILPAVVRAYVTLSMVDRRLAMLRTIEAIRGYAAAHDARVPAKLDDLTDMPAPLDPMTGKPFSYSVNGDVAVIEAPPVEAAGGGRPTGLRYEVRIFD